MQRRDDQLDFWTPRRMVALARQRRRADNSTRFVWLTPQCQQRLSAAGTQHVHNPITFPEGGVVMGFAEPVELSSGAQISALALPSLSRLRLDNTSRRRLAHAMNQRVPVLTTVRMWGYSRNFDAVASMMLLPVDNRIDISTHTYTLVSDYRPVNAAAAAEGNSAMPPRDAAAVWGLMRAAWTVLDNPAEAADSDTAVTSDAIVYGTEHGTKKRKRLLRQDVSVIDIHQRHVREAADSNPANEPVERDHCWQVSGHWRMQPCGPKRSQRRRIWIADHIAGPQDKPLRTRPKVAVIHADAVPGEQR